MINHPGARLSSPTIFMKGRGMIVDSYVRIDVAFEPHLNFLTEWVVSQKSCMQSQELVNIF